MCIIIIIIIFIINSFTIFLDGFLKKKRVKKVGDIYIYVEDNAEIEINEIEIEIISDINRIKILETLLETELLTWNGFLWCNKLNFRSVLLSF
jgi:hypothetical protein